MECVCVVVVGFLLICLLKFLIIFLFLGQIFFFRMHIKILWMDVSAFSSYALVFFCRPHMSFFRLHFFTVPTKWNIYLKKSIYPSLIIWGDLSLWGVGHRRPSLKNVYKCYVYALTWKVNFSFPFTKYTYVLKILLYFRETTSPGVKKYPLSEIETLENKG